MATTANYGWTTPDDTDLVKDGASAIRTLGSAIDTTVKANADATGLVHINTTSFSAVASQSVNDVFSATYKNYMIVLQLTGNQATSTGLRLRTRVSGTDTTTGYSCASKFMAFNTTTTFDVATSPTDSFHFGFIPNAGDGRFSGYVNVFNPFESGVVTSVQGMATGTNTGAYKGFGIYGGVESTAATKDGFTLYPSGGTMTGTIQVFGYKE